MASPATPPLLPIIDTLQSAVSTPSLDSSIESLSFDFEFDDAGNYIRHSRGSSAGKPRSTKSNGSSPPTPQEDILDNASKLNAAAKISSPSPLSAQQTTLSAPRRSSLSRSESAYPVLMTVRDPSSSSSMSAVPATVGSSQVTSAAPRSFQRVSSGPVRALPIRRNLLASTAASSGASKLSASEDARSRIHTRDRPDLAPSKHSEFANVRARMEEASRAAEKENHDSAQVEPEHESDQPRLQQESHPRLEAISKAASIVRSVSASSTSSISSSSSRPLADVPVPQRTRTANPASSASRFGRLANKASSKHSAMPRRITEVESEPEIGVDDYADATQQCASEGPPSATRQRTYGSNSVSEAAIASEALVRSGNTRPRRSASLSDCLAQDEHGMLKSSANRENAATNGSLTKYSRSGSALDLNSSTTTTVGDDFGPRRVTLEEAEITRKKVREEAERVERQAQESLASSQQQPLRRKSPSPTHLAPSAAARLRPSQAHKRRDSDTLRSVASMASFPTSSSTTAVASTSSPTVVEPTAGRISPSARSALPSIRHRRSPTAPEHPTNSSLKPDAAPVQAKTWANDAPSSSEKDPVRERERAVSHLKSAPPVPTPAQVQLEQLQQLLAQQQQQQSTSSKTDKSNTIMINRKPFVRLDLIGKGGSSRVFRVMSPSNELFAVKRVSLDKIDAETMQGYMNEIALLKRLEGNSRIIRLVESEVKPGSSSGSKGHLLLMMECGEVDMAKLLSEQMKDPHNMVWVAYYWQQMLQAVQVIHDEKIVHSDLKPANFVLVKGQLKLIDFGIANAIANDTTNIQRDHQIGTVNYMSPEAIELSEGQRRLKVGRPSDVWSLGCILYQMVYGHPPFHHLSMYQKMKVIPDPNHIIECPEYTSPPSPSSNKGGAGDNGKPFVRKKVRPDVIEAIQRCLKRQPKERATIPELLELDWLTMRAPEDSKPKEINIHEHLGKEETVINPHFMMQLLQYGMRLGSEGKEIDLVAESARLVAELKSVAASQ